MLPLMMLWFTLGGMIKQQQKISRQIIKEHEGFFDGLSDIDTVIVIGHSLSEVDMEYFEKICSEIHSDAKWIFSCHDSAGLKAINAIRKDHGYRSR